ncbi:MAG TPA: flavodoxin domain-containing protein [Candidatus Acidoferrales bacterium]|nr:flavodoxin domain-containing protein [Candidatus Acidoferrales bacterium]
MSRILVLYYSRTGNTEKMALAVADGAKSVPGTQVELNYYVPQEELMGFDAILVGAATYHHDMPVTLKNYFEEAAVKNVMLKGKIGAAFGSYGWSGEASRLVLEILRNRFGMEVTEPPLSVAYTPDQASLEKCFALGKRVAESLIHKA